MKYNHTSANTSFVDHPQQAHDQQKPLKFLSSNDFKLIKSINQKFYLRYYLLIAVVLSNNLAYYSLNPTALTLLMVSIGLLLFLIVISLMTMIYAENEDLGLIPYIFSYPMLMILTGVSILLIDPITISLIFDENYETYLSSLQSFILLSALGYKYSQISFRFPFFILTLGSISLGLNLLYTPSSGKAIYEYIILVAFLLSGSLYLKPFKTSKIEKSVQNQQTFSGVEEITNKIDGILENLIEINENSERKQSLDQIIEQVKEINNKIRKSPNIYSVQINTVTKNMDEQDKIFIEQACFESFNHSSGYSPKPIEYAKEYELNYGISELMGVLKNIGNEWNFNTFFITDCSGSTPIQVIGTYTIKRFGLEDTFFMTEEVLKSFFFELESKYEKNPYHNSTHAADVMCSLVYLIQNSMLVDHITSLELLSCVIAALAHDVGHPGKNNRFLVITKNDIAILYNDLSVLEMMHASLLFQIIKNKETNIFLTLSNDKYPIARKEIIEMILATDMGKHFELLGQFKAKYLNSDLHDLSDTDTRLDLFKLIIKAADIGHAAKSIELHENWCNLVIQEFYEQGDIEKSLGLPVSMYCDRETTDVSKSQAGFIKNIVYPLYNSLNIVLSSQQIEEKCVQQLILNQQHWEFRRKTIRGQSLISKAEKVVGIASFLPKLKIRKGSLPREF